MKAPIAEARTSRLSFWQVVRNRWGTISFTVVLLCLVVMGVGRLIEREWVGRVRFQVGHRSKGENDHWIEKELKLITDEATMLRVVRKLNLARTWKLNGDESAAMTRLSRMVETSEDRSTDIFAIEVYSPEAEEAVMLANAIADAFEDRHKENQKEHWQERQQQVMKILAMEVDAQRKLLASKRSEMLRIKEQYRIVDFSAIDGSAPLGNQAENGYEMICKSARQHAAEYKREVERLELQLNALLSLSNQNDLLAQTTIMNPDRNIVKIAISKLTSFKLYLAKIKDEGLGEKHPTFKAIHGPIKPISEQLATSVEDFKSTLRTKIQLAKGSLALIDESIQKDEDGLMVDRTKYDEYLTAKKDCEQQSRKLEEMQAHILGKVAQVDMGLEIPMTPVVRVENAAKAQKVARPNTPMLLAVGASVGLVLGIALAYFRESRKPSP